MFEKTCAHQPAFLDAAAAGRETDAAFAEHLAACPSCREAVEAVRWMRRLADTPSEAHALPNPDLIWWKAQLLRRWEVERRASAPIDKMHKAELFAGLASLVVFIVWQWSGLTRMVSNVVPSMLANWSARAASGNVTGDTSSLIFLLGSLFLGGMILAGVHRMLSDH